MANAFIHGKRGVVSIGGTYFATLQFDFVESTSLDDITYTGSASGSIGVAFKVLLPGYNWATGTLTFVYDSINQPMISPQDMIVGTLMTLILFPDGVQQYAFSAYSGQFRFASGPKAGAVQCTTNFESTGTITRPSTTNS